MGAVKVKYVSKAPMRPGQWHDGIRAAVTGQPGGMTLGTGQLAARRGRLRLDGRADRADRACAWCARI